MSLETFTESFNGHLGSTSRWWSFLYIAKALYSLKRPVAILETGCARLEGNWAGDGQSTLLWDFIVGDTGGRATSIDINAKSCSVAASLAKRVEIKNSDSISWLASNGASCAELDLLYLDSFDYDGSPFAALHHCGELAAVYRYLKSGCMIAVDDCHADNAGKHVYVAGFFADLGVAPKCVGYVTVWCKP